MGIQARKGSLCLLVAAMASLVSIGGDGEGPQMKGIAPKADDQRVLAEGGDGVGPRGPKGGVPHGAGPRKIS